MFGPAVAGLGQGGPDLVFAGSKSSNKEYTEF